MKKKTFGIVAAVVLAVCLALAAVNATSARRSADSLAGDAAAEAADRVDASSPEASTEEAPREPVHLTVGNTTKVSGRFFTTFFGNNTSDIDVRTMIHGYNPVVWIEEQVFTPDYNVVDSLEKVQEDSGATYVFRLQEDLVYCDGTTPITARDYVFAWALSASPELAAIGAQAPLANVEGYEAFASGENTCFSGVHLLDDYTFSITIKEENDPYFYDMSQLAMYPYPISVLAPGCTVRDDGEGVYITGENGQEDVFTAELLEKTILDPETGYLSHPSLTCGPYMLTAYDAESGTVDFAINPYYKGNYENAVPTIDFVTLVPVTSENMIAKLEAGEVDLLNKCVDRTVIEQGLKLAYGENEEDGEDGENAEDAGDAGESAFSAQEYPRLGYGFCAFSCEKWPMRSRKVRQAVSYAFDAETFLEEALGEYGVPVYGIYGVGQWMYEAAELGVIPDGAYKEDEEEEDWEKEWEKISLDSLNHYKLNLKKARQLLEDDGWIYNKNGNAYRNGKDTVRYKLYKGELIPLRILFAQSEGNEMAAQVVALFQETLPKLGFDFQVEIVSFGDMLADYYREDGERRFDMNFMATNFVSTYDPYEVFTESEDMQGSVNTSGLKDEKLIELARELRNTEPGDLLQFEKRWVKMQERINLVLPTLPIYSNYYYDFHIAELQNYNADFEYSWPVALLYASCEPAA